MNKGVFLIASLSAGLMACSASFAMRSPDKYREDTRALLASQQGQIESCYNAALDNDKDLQGDVVVSFTVETETGQLSNIKVIEDQSSAPAVLQQCVLNAIGGLVLEPADENQGVATFRWSFSSAS